MDEPDSAYDSRPVRVESIRQAGAQVRYRVARSFRRAGLDDEAPFQGTI